MIRIALCLNSPQILQTAREALADEARYELAIIDDLPPGGDLDEAAGRIIEQKPEVVVAEYWAEDAAGVKLMQKTTDAGGGRPEFIFIDSADEVGREEVLMALNEGAGAFLPSAVSPMSLKNYVDRAASGPGRLRGRQLGDSGDEAALNRLEEQLGAARIKAAGYQKVIAHLLSAQIPARHRQVLVVSDSPYQLELLKKILEEHNFAVLTAADSAGALAVALEEKPRIVVSDLELGSGTGRDLCRELKFDHKLIPCYFIICTANPDKAVLAPGDGVDDCLVKPSGPKDTAEFIARVSMGLLL